MTDWFRSWHGAPTDPKWLLIAKRAGVKPCHVAYTWWALMDHASQSSERGFVGDFDVETFALFAGMEDSHIEKIIGEMKNKGLIVGNKIATWEKRQPKREDNSTQRVQKFRNAAKRNETLDKEQSREEEGSDEPSPGARVDPAKQVKQAVADWNAAAAKHGLSKVTKLNDARRTKLIARLRDCGLEGWQEALAHIERSKYLRGEVNSFRVTFDFLLQEGGFLKLTEGNYDDKDEPALAAEPDPDSLTYEKAGESDEAAKLRRAIAEEVGTKSYRSWFERMSIRIDGDRVAIVAPTTVDADYVRNNLGTQIQRVGKRLFAGSREVIILASTTGRRAAA